MHAPSVDLPTIPDTNVINLAYPAVPTTNSQLKISNLIQEKINAREYFYGIEIAPGLKETLNYNLFKIAPLFTSIVWIASHNLPLESADDSPAFQLAKQVEPSGPVMLHISCYNLTNSKMRQFLKPPLSNALVIRGDEVDAKQEFRHAVDLVKEIRGMRKDDICIAVAGHPEGHPDSTLREDDLRYLKEKVDAGADLIITQLTFSEEALIDFIGGCRRIGITVPIVPGIFVPQTWRSLQFMMDLVKTRIPKDLYFEYENRSRNETEFREFAEQQAVKMIRRIFNSDLGIYGIQFFTLNYFKSVQNIIRQLFV